LEFKLYRGKNSNPISISLTTTQFEWILFNIKNQTTTLSIPGEREGQFICYERPGNILDAIIISIIERKSKFGVLINDFEQLTLVEKSNVILFILKNQNAKGDRLRHLAKDIYAFVLSKMIKIYIDEDCIGCKEESLEHEPHTCLKDHQISEIANYTIKAMEDGKSKLEFENLFDYFAALLNISIVMQLEVKNILMPLIQGNEFEDLVISVKQIHFGEMDSRLTSITKLYERKQEAANDETSNSHINKRIRKE